MDLSRDRPASGGRLCLFILNALVGLAITLVLVAGFMALGMHYILARIVTSMFAGLVLFLLNAVLNFRSL